MKKSTYKSCIDFFNSFPIDHIITREDFLKNVKSTGVWTRDNYRRFLTKAGFLESIERGQYKRIKNIPENLPKRDLEFLAYGDPTSLRRLIIDLDYGLRL